MITMEYLKQLEKEYDECMGVQGCGNATTCFDLINKGRAMLKEALALVEERDTALIALKEIQKVIDVYRKEEVQPQKPPKRTVVIPWDDTRCPRCEEDCYVDNPSSITCEHCGYKFAILYGGIGAGGKSTTN